MGCLCQKRKLLGFEENHYFPFDYPGGGWKWVEGLFGAALLASCLKIVGPEGLERNGLHGHDILLSGPFITLTPALF